MNPAIIITILILLGIVSWILIIAGIIKKSHKRWVSGLILLCLAHIAAFGIISELIIARSYVNKEYFSHLSIMERFNLVIDEINHPYDPCEHTDYDGPVRLDNTSETPLAMMRNIIYDDFILVFDPQSLNAPFPLTSVEMPEYYFSISNAAHAIQKTIIGDVTDEGPLLMIQYMGVSEIKGEMAVEFVYGDGLMDFSCPYYFKVDGKAYVTASGKIYRFQNDVDDDVKYMGEVNPRDTFGDTGDRDFGIHLMQKG